jgi:hypothetical protein
MSYETGAPPPPDHTPVETTRDPAGPVVPAARPARGYDAVNAIQGLTGPPPGTVTYRLRATETTQTSETSETAETD